MRENIKIWGEVQIELKNVHTGLIEKSINVKNTLMDAFIDYIVGAIGFCQGIQYNTNQDQRNAFGKMFQGPGGISPILYNDYCYEPAIIALGTGTTPFTGNEAGLTALAAGTEINTNRSKEGGSGQTSPDNIYLKISSTYDTAQGNGIVISEVGLYGIRLYLLNDNFTAVAAPLVQYTPVPLTPSIWKIHNCIVEDAGTLYPCDHASPALTFRQQYEFSENTQTLSVYDGLGVFSVASQFLSVYEPKIDTILASQPFAIGPFSAGILVPTPFTKTVNHTLTIIWLIHFDRNPVCP